MPQISFPVTIGGESIRQAEIILQLNSEGQHIIPGLVDERNEPIAIQPQAIRRVSGLQANNTLFEPAGLVKTDDSLSPPPTLRTLFDEIVIAMGIGSPNQARRLIKEYNSTAAETESLIGYPRQLVCSIFRQY